MSAQYPVMIAAAVEGDADEVLAVRLIRHAGAELSTCYGRQGKPHLKERVSGYNKAARHSPWIVLVDLDDDAACAPLLCQEWVPDLAENMCFRVVVREIEAWLLADTISIAEFLGVARSKIPSNPEQLATPKEFLVNLARGSRKKAIREDMVPRDGSGRSTGPAYTSRVVEFAGQYWDPERARQKSDSLHRAINGLRQLVRAAAV